ncbi:DUF2188 domain-containing protein [Xanthobacteraceae bacterium Astr-EGSB]|uniref:DUF2188 domain-containing protein n=1 Tax=Astrobacterium formosum TaxID=3069710 RepID=UPI0027AEB1D0|nr:DUF2188 domain-containing protein [Xanthobacteraceae bacterium Astr-EGSB]
MSDKRNYHIIPSPSGGWSVRREGADRSSGVFDRKSDAIDYGRQLARGSNSELVTHGRDGRIQENRVFANDPLPPRDQRPNSILKPKGYGSLRGQFIVKRDMDVTKPIYDQFTKGMKESSRDRKR